jgi:hypothetical protein
LKNHQLNIQFLGNHSLIAANNLVTPPKDGRLVVVRGSDVTPEKRILDTQIPTNMVEDKWLTLEKIQVLQDYLLQSNYDSQEIEYLVDGFSNVFSEFVLFFLKP